MVGGTDVSLVSPILSPTFTRGYKTSLLLQPSLLWDVFSSCTSHSQHALARERCPECAHGAPSSHEDTQNPKEPHRAAATRPGSLEPTRHQI